MKKRCQVYEGLSKTFVLCIRNFKEITAFAPDILLLVQKDIFVSKMSMSNFALDMTVFLWFCLCYFVPYGDHLY